MTSPAVSSRDLPHPARDEIRQQIYRGTARMNGLRRADLDDIFPGLLDALLDAAARQAARLGNA